MSRRQAAAELMETLEHINVPSFIGASDGTVTWLNEAGRRVFGNTIGRPVQAVVAPEHLPLVQQEHSRKLRGSVPVTDYEVEVVTADGRRVPVEISSVPIPGGDQAHAVFGVALPRAPAEPPSRDASLTPRQMEVLQLLGEGASTDQIAEMLHLSRETVRNHIRNILRALGAHSRLEAVAIAQRRGVLRAGERER